MSGVFVQYSIEKLQVKSQVEGNHVKRKKGRYLLLLFFINGFFIINIATYPKCFTTFD